MIFVVFFAVAAVFIVLGIVFLSGKGAGLVAGYNTASKEEKAKTDEKKLLRAMAVFMFVLAGCFILSALSAIFSVKALIWTGQGLFVVSLIIGLVCLNTKNRFKK